MSGGADRTFRFPHSLCVCYRPATDQHIDALVYELYGLTEDEIKLVEGGQ